MRSDRELLGRVLARARAEDQVKGVFSIQSQTTDLRAELVARNDTGFCAIAVEAQTTQICSRQLDRVPFQHNARLCRVAASENGRRGRCLAEGLKDLVLERRELLIGDQFGMLIPRYVDVDYTAGVDVWREEDGWEFDL